MDAERAFSGGRLQVSHLQHGMSSQTFKAHVALASWVDTPFLPPGMPSSILEEAKSRKTGVEGKRKGKAQPKEVIVIEESDGMNFESDWYYFRIQNSL